jgi:hypothetical protein
VKQKIVFEINESNLWNLYSLRSQSLQQFWDFIYYNIKQKFCKK